VTQGFGGFDALIRVKRKGLQRLIEALAINNKLGRNT